MIENDSLQHGIGNSFCPTLDSQGLGLGTIQTPPLQNYFIELL